MDRRVGAVTATPLAGRKLQRWLSCVRKLRHVRALGLGWLEVRLWADLGWVGVSIALWWSVVEDATTPRAR